MRVTLRTRHESEELTESAKLETDVADEMEDRESVDSLDVVEFDIAEGDRLGL